MLDFRRFFQDEDVNLEARLPEPDNIAETPTARSEVVSNVHLIDFSRAEAANTDARFPQVDEILERLDVNAQAVGGALRSVE